jgi:hypothetical protein
LLKMHFFSKVTARFKSALPRSDLRDAH